MDVSNKEFSVFIFFQENLRLNDFEAIKGSSGSHYHNWQRERLSIISGFRRNKSPRAPLGLSKLCKVSNCQSEEVLESVPVCIYN